MSNLLCLVNMRVFMPLLFGAVIITACSFDPMNMSRHLPSTATNVHERRYETGVDYSRYLKATIPRDDYEQFSESLGYTNILTELRMSELNDTRVIPSWNWEDGEKPAWWDINNNDLIDSYFKVGRESFRILTYKNGNLYYKSVSN